MNIGIEIKSLLELIRLQNIYIQQIIPIIYHLSADTALITNSDFQKFTSHFLEFTHYHYNSEGCSQTAQLAQVYQYAFWEKILDTQVLSAAEQMEMAIEYLEEASKAVQIQQQPQMLLLNQSVILIEETQFKIIELLEVMMANSQPVPQLYN